MYNLGDGTFALQPKRMSPETVEALLRRILVHCEKHSQSEVVLVFHGGEPLLAGKLFFRNFCQQARAILHQVVRPHFCMQTNGTLLDDEWLDILYENEIGFGISLDGPKSVNDANRIDHAGNGSYDRVVAAIRRVLADSRFDELFGSVLTVVNLDIDPVKQYRFYRSLGLRGVDFLLPDGTYDQLPPKLQLTGNATPYADWLIAIFNEWFDSGDPSFRIRFFENIMRLVLGSQLSTDNIGGRPNEVMVVETDGGLEPVDVLKSCGDGFTKVGFNVQSNEVDDVYTSHLMRIYQSGYHALSQDCKSCPIVRVCGGGYLPHRYSAKRGFNNRSIYCRDLMKLIKHVQGRFLKELPESFIIRSGLHPIDELQLAPSLA
jgi:uncharacterized protein